MQGAWQKILENLEKEKQKTEDKKNESDSEQILDSVERWN